jgi:AcrR family transcriptional regulator
MNNCSHSILAFGEWKIAVTVSPLSPRKSPRQARGLATRDAIIEAAAQVVAKLGLAGFNTNAVAARAGTSVGSLYQYFPNKDALMVALIHRSQQQQLQAVALAVGNAPAGADIATLIRLIVRAGMQHHRDDSLLASAIDHEEARLPVEDVLQKYLTEGGGMVRALLIHNLPHLTETAVSRAIFTLPALVRAAVDRWANLSPPQLDVAEDEAVRAVLGYLRE